LNQAIFFAKQNDDGELDFSSVVVGHLEVEPDIRDIEWPDCGETQHRELTIQLAASTFPNLLKVTVNRELRLEHVCTHSKLGSEECKKHSGNTDMTAPGTSNTVETQSTLSTLGASHRSSKWVSLARFVPRVCESYKAKEAHLKLDSPFAPLLARLDKDRHDMDLKPVQHLWPKRDTTVTDNPTFFGVDKADEHRQRQCGLMYLLNKLSRVEERGWFELMQLSTDSGLTDTHIVMTVLHLLKQKAQLAQTTLKTYMSGTPK